MKSRMAKLSELETKCKSLFKEKSDLLETVGKLQGKLSVAENDRSKVNKELSSLTDKLHSMQAENEAHKKENSNLLEKQSTLQAQNKEAALTMQGASDLKQGNERLKVLVGQLKANQAAPPVGGAPASGADPGHLIKIKGLEMQKEKLEKGLEEWSQLAQVCLVAVRGFPNKASNSTTALLQGVQGHSPNLQAGREVSLRRRGR